MTFGAWGLSRDDPQRWRLGAAGLIVAAVIVGVAIGVGGTFARVLNPIGAVIWIAAGVLLAMSLPAARRPPLGLAAAAGAGLLLSGVIRPGTLEEAALGFGIAGVLVVLAAGDRTGAWAFLTPTIYLPLHLAIGIGWAIVHGARMRTDPPPTASLVPLMMLVATAVGGLLAAALVRRLR